MFNDFILWWSIWSSQEVPIQDSWQVLLSLRLIFASISGHIVVWYWKKSREREGWYRVMLRVQAAFYCLLVLYMVLKILEIRFLTAPQLTWGVLIFYVAWIGATVIPPVTQLVKKGKEVWDGTERRQKKQVLP